jgi:hypothetical protein
MLFEINKLNLFGIPVTIDLLFLGNDEINLHLLHCIYFAF